MKQAIKSGIIAIAIITIGMLIQSFLTSEQKLTHNTKPKTETYIVGGVCGMCKDRIENAVDVTGVVSATYVTATQKMLIKYQPKKISKEKIEQLVLAKGHDINGKKAPDSIYNKLPLCCRYRTLEKH